MKALPVVFRLEWRNLWSDGTTALILATLAVSIGYGVFNGAHFIWDQQKTLRAFLAAEKHEVDLQRQQNSRTTALIDQGKLDEIAEWSNDPKITPLWPSWDFQLQLSAVQPFSSLAFLAIGQSDIYPAAYKPYSPGRYFKETVVSVEQSENPAKMMTGHFDLAFVILYLLPLFVIAVSYDLIASERESGLLSLILAQPISLRAVVFARVLLRASVVVGATLVLSTAAVALTGIDWNQDDVRFRFLMWQVATSGYALFWFALAIAVNATGKTAASNAMVLAVSWLLLVLLVPAAIRFTATRVFPTPPRSELRNTKRDAIMQTGVDLWEQGVKELDDDNSRTSRLVNEFLTEHPDLQPAGSPPAEQKVRFKLFDYSEPENVRNHSPKWRDVPYLQRFELVNAARTAAIEKMIKPAQNYFDHQYRKQFAVFSTASLFSPATLLERVLTSLGGTSVEQHDRFLEQVEQQHTTWKLFFLRRSLQARLLRPEDFERFPYFQFKPEGRNELLRRLSLPFALLGLLSTSLGILALALVGRHT